MKKFAFLSLLTIFAPTVVFGAGAQLSVLQVSLQPQACYFKSQLVEPDHYYVTANAIGDRTDISCTECPAADRIDKNADMCYARCEKASGEYVHAMHCHILTCRSGYTLTNGKCVLNSDGCEKRCNDLQGDTKNACIACCHVTKDVATWKDNKCNCANKGTFTPLADPKKGGVCKGGNENAGVCDKETGNDKTLCQACIKAQNVTWKSKEKTCDCNDNKLMFDKKVGRCISSECIARCTSLGVADVSPVALQKCELCCQQGRWVQGRNLTTWDTANNKCVSDTDNNITVIQTAVTNLNNLTAGLDVSRWKNAQGKFNTSRLISDSVAGVVLGTAGGLITSNVIKKNQIKNGFEDINCTVGGQVVAGWDDQFSVGIR